MGTTCEVEEASRLIFASLATPWGGESEVEGLPG